MICVWMPLDLDARSHGPEQQLLHADCYAYMAVVELLCSEETNQPS